MLTRILRISSHEGLVGEYTKQRLKLPMINWLISVNKEIHRRMLSNRRTGAHDNSKDSISYIKNVYADDRCLKVAWSNGTASRFPLNFLRDNCKCPECFEPSSKQNLFNTARDLMKDIEIDQAVISDDGQYLNCIWPGGHKSSYSLHWLHDMRMPEENKVRPRNSDSLVKDEPILWNREMMQDNVPLYDYNLLMNEDKGLFDSLYCLYQNGILVIDNAPARDGVLMELAARIGYHKRTHYGDTFDVKDVESPSSLAYTNNALKFHTDMPYVQDAPNIQLLHCIYETSSGGESMFVDGFNVIKQLQENHPDAFDVLKTFSVRFSDYGTDAFGEFAFGYSRPLISLNRHGRINSLQYSPLVESEFKGDYTPDELLAFYDSAYIFTKELQDPKNVIDFRLKSGQIVMFHNTRLFHGRTEFVSTVGEPMARWLQGIYFEWDLIFSKLRVLQKRLGLKSPHLPEQSDDFF